MKRSRLSTRPGGRSGTIGLVAVSALLGVPAVSAAANVSGSVYNDFNTNGQRDGAAGSGAVDIGVGGLTVRAYDASGALVGTATTDTTPGATAGSYTLTGLPNARVRLELTVPSGYQPSRQLGGLRSDVRFVDASAPVTGVTFGVHRAREYSVDNPLTSWVNQYAGPARTDRGQAVIKSTPFFATQGFQGVFDPAAAGNSTRATFGQVGTVFGLAQDQSNGDLYAGAFYKRFAGLTDSGAGAIFRVTQGNTVTRFADIAAGADGHPTSTVTNQWFTGATKDASWDAVGKRGLGSVEIDQASRSLYTVNLASGRFVRLSLDGTYPTELPETTGTVIPNPSCTGGDWRPFSVGINPADGQVYVGGVCDATSSQTTTDLKAVVYRVTNPNSAAPTFTEAFSTPLTYNRVNTNSAPNTPTTTGTNKSNSAWRPWPTAASIAPATVPTGTTRPDRTTPFGPVFSYRESYPQLTSLTFDADGSLQLGMRDLMGDIAGVEIENEDNFTAIAQGDLLRAAPAGAGWTLENGGTSGGRQGVGRTAVHGAIGPGGGYFYSPRPGYTSSPATPGRANELPEPSAFAGGFLQVPGFREIASTGFDTADPNGSGLYNTDGVLWQSNADGTNQRGFTNRSLAINNGTDLSETGSFGKANGLGDLAAFTREAPVQIGNRVWLDSNQNGVQDPDESPIAGVTVELVDPACAATTGPGNPPVTTATTNADGEYVFSINPIAAGNTCQVRIALNQAPLLGLTPTSVGAGGNDRIDSDGGPTGNFVVATVGPHGVGENDHSFDFGFFRTPTPPVTPPVVPPTTPPVVPPVPPTTPPVTPPLTPPGTPVIPPIVPPTVILPPTGTNPNDGTRTRSLSIRKSANRSRVLPGQTIRYRLRVFADASGTSDAVNETICDVLPANLTLVDRGGGTIRNGRLCWTIRRLPPGQSLSRSFTVRVDRDARPGRVINRATVTDLGQNRTNSRTVRVLKRKVPTADNSYVTG